MKKEIESELEKIDYNEIVEYLTKRRNEEENKRLQKLEPILKITNIGMNNLAKIIMKEVNENIVIPIQNKKFPKLIKIEEIRIR